MSFSRHRRQLLLAGAAIATARPARAAQPVRTAWPRRKPTPSLRLSLLDGAAWTLQQQRGHAVLLNFWASWCGPCIEEMPALARLAERERPRGLRVVAVNYRESADAIRGFLERAPVALDVALDRDGSAAKAFDAHVFPSTVAIGADGRARFVVVGECDWMDDRSRRWLDDLLESRDRG
jgi:thiol-disulfide isomerase/thioredoxin